MIVPRRIRILAICLATVISAAYAKSAKKIINGELSRTSEFPHLVSLQQDNFPFCGGNIIDATTILTAGHCAVSSDHQKRKGVVVVTGTIDNKAVTADNVFPVAEIFIHCRFDPVYLEHDIAIFKLAKPIPFNDNQKPIRLPTRDHLSGKKVMTAGWGAIVWDQAKRNGEYPRFLQKIETTIVSIEECKERLAKQEDYSVGLHDGKMCALAKAGSGICYGDGGGSLIYEGEVIGITSSVIPCGKGYPDIYTRVITYLPWIKRIMARGH